MNPSDGAQQRLSNETLPWRRVSPIAIIYFLISNVQHTLNFWPALIAALTNQSARNWFFSFGVPVLVLILIAFALLSYWFFRYQFDAEKIQIRSGIFRKKRLTLHFERVQEANLEQAIYFRPFGLWTLRLESAGSGKEEIALPGIPEPLAMDIKQRVLISKTFVVEAAPEHEVSMADYEVKLGIADLVRYGLMHNTLIYLAAILVPFLSQIETFWHHMANFVERLSFTHWLLEYLSAHSMVAGAIVIALLLIAFFIVIYSLSIALAVIKYWKYRLIVQDERLQYEAGLFNRVACGFRKHKLQVVIIKQSLIARFLQRYSLEVRQTNDVMQAQGQLQGFIIPVVDKTQLEQLMSILSVEMPQWQRTSPVQIFWNSLLWGSFLALCVAVLVIFTEASPFWIGLPLLLMTFLCWRYWYTTRYGLAENGFALKRGLLGYTTVYIPYIKIQKLQLSQGPVSRLHACAGMTLWSGATFLSVGYINIDRLTAIHQILLQRVASHRGSWM